MGAGFLTPAVPLWGTAEAFGMREVVQALEAGQVPPPDGGLTIVPESTRPGVFAFSQHHVIATDVDPAWVRARIGDDLARPFSSDFLASLGARMGRVPDGVDMMIYGPKLDEPAPGVPPMVEVGLDHHPLIARATRYRDDVRAWSTQGGCMCIGRGIGDRWELTVWVEPEYRGLGLGLALLQAGQYLVPGTVLWAQISVGNALILRNAARYGWSIIGAEVLLVP
jgi:GNAT superfamily N-acetyltransferase